MAGIRVDADRQSTRLRVLSDTAGRLLLVGIAVVGAGLVAERLRIVLLPTFVAFLLVTVLSPPARHLERRGLPAAAATWTVFLLLLAGATGAVLLLVRPIAAQADDMGPALSDAFDDIETWLVGEPLRLDPRTVADTRSSLGDQFGDLVGGGAIAGAVAVGEFVAGAVLALALTFFAVKDAPLLQRWALGIVPITKQDKARAAGAAVVHALRGYLLGAAILGAVEAVILTVTLTLVGADLTVVIGGLTFMGAFFPFVGATAAGLVAVLVTLVSAGTGGALIVAAVAVLVQQFDNELLAPVIYGRTTRLHPIAVLLAVATGATVGGIAGAFVAVPMLAATSAAVSAIRSGSDQELPENGRAQSSASRPTRLLDDG